MTKYDLKYYRIYYWAGAILILSLLGSVGCGDKHPEEDPSRLPMERLSTGEFPRFQDSLDFKDLEASFLQSLVYFARIPAKRTFIYGKDRYDAAHMIRSLETFRSFLSDQPTASQLNRFIRDRFNVYKSVGNDEGEVLFTGILSPPTGAVLNRVLNSPFPCILCPGICSKSICPNFRISIRGISVSRPGWILNPAGSCPIMPERISTAPRILQIGPHLWSGWQAGWTGFSLKSRGLAGWSWIQER